MANRSRWSNSSQRWRRSSATGNSEQEQWLRYIKEVYPNRHSETNFLPPGYLKPVPHTCVDYHGEKVRVYESSSTPPPPPPPSPSPSSTPMPTPTHGSTQQRQQQQQRRRRQRSESRSSGGPEDSTQPSPQPQVAGRVYVSNPDSLEALRVQDSDRQDKDAMEWVLRHLYVFAEDRSHKQIMMVISGLKFMKYLSLRNSSKCSKYPRPMDAGEFDLIIISKDKGVITCEVKSVKKAADMTNDEYLKAVSQKVDRAMDQLEKQANNLRYMVSDIGGGVAVSKTLIMPNVTKQELRDAMDLKGDVSQKLQKYLEVHCLEQALSKCLLKDQMTPCDARREVDPRVKSHLIQWLNEAGSARHGTMTDSDYDTLYARFCGPVTEIEMATVSKPHRAISTMGQYVAETGIRFSLLALYPSQVVLLSSEEPMVFIVGPPGTGKTVVLALKARQWLSEKPHIKVHVVSTRFNGRAVSLLLQRQLQLSPNGQGQGFDGRVDVHHYDFNTSQDQVDKAVKELVAQAVDDELYVVMDEVGNRYRDRFKEMCEKLKEKIPSLHLWVADVQGDSDDIPDCLERKEMHTMLRCPPVIHEQIKLSDNIVVDSVRYSDDHLPHTHGPNPIWLSHRGVTGHTEGEPKSCYECGKMIGRTLEDLEIGSEGTDPLAFRDVLIAYSNADDDESPLQNNSPENRGPEKVPPFVDGLRSCGVDVRVLKRHDDISAFSEVACAKYNEVVVSNWQNVAGLERRVVVGMGDLTSMDRFYVVSRCTSQLIWIDRNVTPTKGPF